MLKEKLDECLQFYALIMPRPDEREKWVASILALVRAEVETRIGKECKRVKCKNYVCYSQWSANLGSRELQECMECKHAHVSQYKAISQHPFRAS